MMTEETREESLAIDVEFANAKADLAIEILTGMFRELYGAGVLTQTISQLASIAPKRDFEHSDPAAAFALIDLETGDPDDPFDIKNRRVREKVRLRKLMLDAIRRDHQNLTR